MNIAATVTTPMAAAMEEDMAASRTMLLRLLLPVRRVLLPLARLPLLALLVLPTTLLNTPSTMVVLIRMLPTGDTRTILPITSTTSRLLSNSNSNLKAHHPLLRLVKLLRHLHLLVLARRPRLLGEVVIMPYVPPKIVKMMRRLTRDRFRHLLVCKRSVDRTRP